MKENKNNKNAFITSIKKFLVEAKLLLVNLVVVSKSS